MGLPINSCRPTLFFARFYLLVEAHAVKSGGKTTIIGGETTVKNLKDYNKIVTLRVNMYIIANT